MFPAIFALGAALVTGTTVTAATAAAAAAGAYLIHKKVKNDTIIKAQKRGRERAAKIYEKQLKELEQMVAELKNAYNKTDSELIAERAKLLEQIKDLANEHDNLITTAKNKGIDTDKLGYKKYSSGFGMYTNMPLPTDFLFAYDSIYAEYEDKAFREASALYQARILEEQDNIAKQKKATEAMIDKGKEQKAKYISEISKLRLEKVHLKILINSCRDISE